jgi:pimeloyl-ACP methyl ester carboxylesterase
MDLWFAENNKERLFLAIILPLLIAVTLLLYSPYMLNQGLADHTERYYIYGKSNESDPSPIIQDLTSSTNTSIIGTISDGVSKILIKFPYDKKVQFSIEGKEPDDPTDGTLSGAMVRQLDNTSSITLDPVPTGNGSPLKVIKVIYTPPDFLNYTAGMYKTIQIVVTDSLHSLTNPIAKIPIRLYHPPVVLVHGLWEPPNMWTETYFKQALEQKGFDITLADYSDHNAETFDPYNISGIGNYGIESVKNATDIAIHKYHNNSIAATQVDMIGHSMGGLIIRGFVQQPSYSNEDNFMKGYIHRLITIGTPHYGAQLAGILHKYQNKLFCFTGLAFEPAAHCKDPKELKFIYRNNFSLPIDDGGVEALIPNSTAYSRLCQTNVPSYSMAGKWTPDGNHSHNNTEQFFRNLTNDSELSLEDIFQGENDLQVNLTNQAGGLIAKIREQGGPQAVPNQSAIYPNLVHSFRYLDNRDKDIGVNYETNSDTIQQDVITLLNSPTNKFADAIGIGAACHVPK